MPSSGEREKVVRRRLADGTVKEYRYAAKPERRSRVAADSLGALIQAYKRGPEYASLAPSTVKNYGYYLRDLEELADIPVLDIRRRTLLAMRDAIAAERGHGAGNVFMSTAATLFNWARDREWVEHSPAERVRALPGGHLPAWTSAEADKAISELPEAFRRVVILARYTGQRRGDLIAMTWRAYDGSTIIVQQEKGARRHKRPALVIPAHPVLRAALDEWKKTASSTHILTAPNGSPWKPNHLTGQMGRFLPEIGLREDLNVHGLRKLAATDLADAGCSAHEIAAITGHKTLAMVQLYTASADQERLAKSAIVRLENGVRKT